MSDISPFTNKPTLRDRQTKQLAYQIYDDRTDELIADIYIHTDDTYSADLIKTTGVLPGIFGWPISGSKPHPESQYILAFLKGRVIPENRDMLDYILEVNNIPYYDWQILIKLNHGRTTDDPYRVESLI